MKVKKTIIFLSLLFMLLGQWMLSPAQIIMRSTDSKHEQLVKVKRILLYSIDSMRTFYPDCGSMGCRGYIAGIRDTLSEEFTRLGEPIPKTRELLKSPDIISDKLKIRGYVKPDNSAIKLTLLYELKDDFQRMHSIFKVGYNIYFLLRDSVKTGKKTFNGIYRLNEEKWYELYSATNFRLAADLGKNRVLGYTPDKPFRLYGFNKNFRDEFFIELPDFRYRQGIYKLNQNKFLFHNFRLRPQDHAVEVYGIDGKRIKECFNHIPYIFEQRHDEPISFQTVLTTDKKGRFYIAFQYPLNPYRVWIFDEHGTKLKVFGNYFIDPEVYESPGEWIRLSSEEIGRFGIDKIYSINKLLVDAQGRILVFFSKNRITRTLRGKNEQAYFLDVYSNRGEFIGRTEFPYGFPALIDNGLIYSRKRDPSGRFMWKITVVHLKIK